jgi:hypothetical protein
MSRVESRGAVKSLLLVFLLAAAAGLASCGAAPVSTAVTCTTSTSTASTTTSSSTCTDPVTNITLTISPATISLAAQGPSFPFSAFVSGGTNSVITWQVNGKFPGDGTAGTIDSAGDYIPPTVVPSPATVNITATSFEDPKLSATAVVTITPIPVVTITSPSAPVTVTSGPANTVQFSATETGGTTNTILWSVGAVGGNGVPGGNATLGTINANGVYSPPATPPIGQTVVVIAQAQDSLTSTASLDVTISGYSTSSLQGPFAFALSGSNASGRFFRAGSFAADGAGHLNSVIEDVNAAGSVLPTVFTTGAYTIGADGRGALQFNDGLLPASFDFVLANGSQLQIIGFDATGTASGQANLQKASTFASSPLSALNGTYVFDFTGVDAAAALSQIGEFSADGVGNIKQALVDVNDGGTLSSPAIFGSKTVCTPPVNTTPTPPAPSSYTVATTGRGTLTLNAYDPATCDATGVSFVFDFYVISLGGAKFIGADPLQPVAGFTTQQAPNAAFSASTLNGGFAFLLQGSQSGAPIATAGSFVTDGNGNLLSGMLDENLNGAPSAGGLPFVSNGTTAGTYTLAANGRGTINFATSARAYLLVFYVGPTGTTTTAVVQETDTGITSDGSATLQQTAPFTIASVAGNYAIQTTGVSGVSIQDVTGQFAANGAGNVTAGAVDVNIGGALTPAVAVTGTYTAPVASGRATLALVPGNLNFAAYVVSPTQVYVIGIQAGALAAGQLYRQF